ncbi:(2Fe-2S) ferredoxin domain-containing protein [Deinococcus psychrotolerans]|uniref:(2Fe-2S) ferredoxin domain-containing protein n=1 Tax=Deinococcus psychrotolerans TaxID=2489213 RepID=A0A3G8Y8H3_9DEIO|nr:NAD(P)H-dependent oxidoreductase subunit E [Deinococcus psychrotolerans]AZI41668.1 (2Fe-2S) ferredoxin domain-containing protein [Deinococcus psychrotolerans]
MSAPRYFPTTGHLLICQNSNCKARGSDLLYRAVWNALEQDKLAYYKAGGSLRLTESGCLGGCKSGPVMTCYRTRDGQMEEAWYAAVDFPLARQVAQAIHDEAELPGERRYGP